MSDKPIEDGFPEAAFNDWCQLGDYADAENCARWGYAEGLKAGRAEAMKLREAAFEATNWLNIEGIREINPKHPNVILHDALAAFDKGRGDGTA